MLCFTVNCFFLPACYVSLLTVFFTSISADKAEAKILPKFLGVGRTLLSTYFRFINQYERNQIANQFIS